MIVIEGPGAISPFPSGLGVARPRSEPRLLAVRASCLVLAWFSLACPVRPLSGATGTSRVTGACDAVKPWVRNPCFLWIRSVSGLVALAKTPRLARWHHHPPDRL